MPATELLPSLTRTAGMAVLLLIHIQEGFSQHSRQEILKLNETAIAISDRNPDSTLALSKEIRRRSEATNYDKGIVLSHLLTSFLFINQYKTDSARLLLDQCAKYFDNNPDKQNTLDHGRVYLYTGWVEMKDDELPTAKSNAISALLIFRALHHPKYIASAHTLMGTVELAVTNYPLSLQHFLDAYKIKTGSGAPEEECRNEIYNISVVYGKMGQHAEALEYTFKSLAIAQKLNDIPATINALNNIGTIHSTTGEVDSARYYYLKSKEIAQTAGIKYLAFIAEYNIANLYSNTGRFRESNELTSKLLSSTPGLPANSVEILHTLMAKNHHHEKNYRTAIALARPLFEEASQKNHKQSVINVTEILWNAYREIGQFDSSFHFLLTHFALKDSVYGLENQRKLSTLYAELETIEKQAAIDSLEKDQLIKKSEYQNLVMLLALGSVITALLVASIVLAARNRERKQRLINIELQSELKKNRQALHQQALRIIYINNGLADVEQSLKQLRAKLNDGKQQEVQQIINTLHLNKSLEKEWDNFDEYFGNVHGGFMKTINETYPELTTAEKRLASLIKMNLTNREIASILNIEPSSVKMAKYRLKRKLTLSEDQDIHAFFQNIT